MLRSIILLFFIFVCSPNSNAQGYILIPMDEHQANHMKAYGITYQVLAAKQEAFWLLNYKGGSFAFR